MNVKTTIAFAEDDFDRLLEVSYANGLRVIAPEDGVSRAMRITLEISAGSVLLRVVYYGFKVDGGETKNIRVWHEDLTPVPESIVMITGPDATNAIEAGVAALEQPVPKKRGRS